MNDKGAIAGYYYPFAGPACHGFLRHPKGAVATFDAPGAECTRPASINKSGAVAGESGDSDGALHGFIRNSDGTFVLFDVPNAEATAAEAIDDAGEVIGSFDKSRGRAGGFIRERDGTITKFGVDGASQTAALSIAVQPDGTSTSTGYALLKNSSAIAFLRNGKGHLTTFQAPGAGGALNQGTFALSINRKGMIAGYVVDANSNTHGFVRTP